MTSSPHQPRHDHGEDGTKDKGPRACVDRAAQLVEHVTALLFKLHGYWTKCQLFFFAVMALLHKRPARASSSTEKKSMKVSMKAKRPSVVARGSRMRVAVFLGRKHKTYTGLTKNDLMKNAEGRIVSKRISAFSRKRWAGSRCHEWNKAVVAARKQLSLVGFVAINSSSSQGRALYVKARSIFSSAA